MTKYFEKKNSILTDLQNVKTSKLIITAIQNIVLKIYIGKNGNLRFGMLSELMSKSDQFLKLYYRSLFKLINGQEETKKIFQKTLIAIAVEKEKKKKSQNQWKIAECISERNQENEDSQDSVQEEPVVKMHSLFSQNENSEQPSPKNVFEKIKTKSLMFFLDEFFILLLKQMTILGVMQKMYVIFN